MSRLKICATLVTAILAGFVVAPATSYAQYDLSTCSGNYNYCAEWARRQGQTDASCQAAYQQCLRRGTWSRQDPYSPRPQSVPVERK